MMQEFIFKRIDNGTFSAIEYRGNDEEVVVPSVHAGEKVTVLYDRLFKGHEEIKTLLIPDTVTDIGAFVFDGCRNLKTICLPSGLLYLWQYAFCRSSITQILLPDRIRTIAPYTFKDCRDLKRIVCNPSLKEIKARAFEGCSPDLEIIHEKNLRISPRAFGGAGEK